MYLLEGVGEALLHQGCPSLGDLPPVREVHPTTPLLQRLGLGQMMRSASLTCLGCDKPMKDPGCLLQDVIQLMRAALLLVIMRVLLNQVLMTGASQICSGYRMLEFVN